MNKPHRSNIDFKLNPIAASVVVAMTQLAMGVAHAGSGYGAGTFAANPALTVPIQTYYANSPSGPAVDLVTTPGMPTIDATTQLPLTVNTGTALRKFVDTLPGFPGLNASGFLGSANNLGQVIPIAQAEKWVDTNGKVSGDDYYEIAAIEYTEKMHSDLPKATRQRGYVQLSTAANPGQHIALTYPDGTPILDATGAQVFAHDAPHHLGPMIVATRDVPVRVKFTNYLPVGGNLFLPVDKTITGAGFGPDGKTYYTENRAEIHLVGGQAPWISAGSPHQWVAPAGETAAYAAGLGKGTSNKDVPDMAPSGAGTTTLYFPNAQSARISFYQDRTSGLTRLNAYAGLEAGYMVTDTVEQNMVAAGSLPADQIPLILEDKTFVPANIAQQDAKWDVTHWGATGDLWFPHVYETNQDPTSVDGTNPVGRWDYGPWFWPIFPASIALPTGVYGDASFTPEAYHDTPLVNGTAYPTLTVDPKAYRIRIVNASTDRYFNLGWYVADSTQVAPQLDANGFPMFDAVSGAPLYFTNTEVKMVPASADTTGAPLTPGPIAGTVPAGQLYDAACLCQFPAMQPQQPAIQFSGPNRAWPIDSRPGGAPDPTAVGPDFVAYGNDGGILPNPIDVPSQPITYESNRRSVTVSNVYGYGLLVGPSERADTVVDFTNYAGQTLILFNDAPAPFPFSDVRDDYFTNNGDQTTSGGAYSTQAGYGPNTRTVMQVVVNPVAVAASGQFDPNTLLTTLPAAYALSQPAPIVPQAAYNAAFGTNDTDVYGHVASGSVAQPNLDFTTSAANLVIDRIDLISSGGQLIVGTNNIVGNAIPGSGQGYDPLNPPTVVFNNGACLAVGGLSAAGHSIVDPLSRQVTSVVLDNPGAGYTCVPQVTFLGDGVGAQATVHTTTTQSILVQTKAEQELFDYAGRYNQTGGVELPLTSGQTQTTVPLSYIDAPTEFINDGEVQIWKLVDNGFWTNSVHFDMVDVQLVNRVGWDGTVKAPATNEQGWKDTLRLNPLEDVIVAMRAKSAPTPFGLPSSVRMLDPSVKSGANGSNLGFMADPGVTSPAPANTPLLTTTVNVSQNFDNEFVWGTAILSHSEDDFMRPVVFHPTVLVPTAPSGLTGTGGLVNWIDATPAGAAGTLSNPANEVGFTVNRAVYTNGVAGAYKPLATVPANTTSYTDITQAVGVDYAYTVTAFNNAGKATSATPLIELTPPAVATWGQNPVSIDPVTGAVTLKWNAAKGATSYIITADGTVIGNPVAAVAGNTQTATVALPLNANYTNITVTSVKTEYGTTLTSAASTGQAANLIVTAPAAPTATANINQTSGAVTVNWGNVTGATSYQVSVDGGAYVTATSGSVVPMATGSVHSVTVVAVTTKWGYSATSVASAPVAVDLTVKAPAAPVATANINQATGAVTVNWANVSGATGYLVTVDNGTAVAATSGSVIPMAAGSLHTVSVQAVTTKWGYTATSAASAAVTVDLTVAAPASPTVTTSINQATGAVTLNWANVTGATSYQVSVDGGAYVTTARGSVVPMAAGSVHTVDVISVTTKWGVTVNSAPATVVNIDLTVAAPAAPAPTTSINQATGAVTVNWANVSGATSYLVALDGGAYATAVSGASYTLAAGSVHTVSVMAVTTKWGVTVNSAAGNVSVNLVVAAPAAPAATAAINAATGAVTLTWANVTGATSYQVSVDGGAYATATSGSVVAMATGSVHSVNVIAVTSKWNQVVNSAVNTVSVDLTVAAPATPAATAAISNTTGVVTMSWANVTGATSYQMSVDGGAYATATSGAVAAMAVGSTHTVNVRAVTLKWGVTTYSAAAVVPVDLTVTATAAPVATAAISQTSGAVTMSWTAVTGATSYQMSVDGGAYATATSGSTVAGMTLGALHSVNVRTVTTKYGITVYSAAATVPVDLRYPTVAAPASASITGQTATAATLNWTAVPGATSYVITRSTNGAAATQLGTVTSPATTLALTIAAGNNYTYAVTARQALYGQTFSSATATSTTLSTAPAASTNARATAGATGTKQIAVSWTNTSGNILPLPPGMTVTMSANGAAAVPITATIAKAGTSYSFTQTGLTAGVSYVFNITASSAGGTSTVSTTAVKAQ